MTTNILNRNVAVKIPNSFKDVEIKKFVQQIEALILFKYHPNILTIIGWTLYGDIPVLITELAETNLLNYVQTISNHQNFKKFSLQVLWQISNALAYVASHKMIHRDVACRNILCMEGGVVKLADFDLCCFCDKNGIFKDTMNNKLPIKWLSIEALTNGIFSEKSDVWAFGILCYEIFSFGSIPYDSMSPIEMMQFLELDKRLEKPDGTPDYIYDLMIKCWDKESKYRPNFIQINKKITSKLENETFKYGYLTLKKIFVKP
uniref:Protein kinase domain-containing protein n=1 Tax=Panagrolaimus davidi TaxID=227884 RepID=A0A914Q3N4_9BILA